MPLGGEGWPAASIQKTLDNRKKSRVSAFLNVQKPAEPPDRKQQRVPRPAPLQLSAHAPRLPAARQSPLAFRNWHFETPNVNRSAAGSASPHQIFRRALP